MFIRNYAKWDSSEKEAATQRASFYYEQGTNLKTVKTTSCLVLFFNDWENRKKIRYINIRETSRRNQLCRRTYGVSQADFSWAKLQQQQQLINGRFTIWKLLLLGFKACVRKSYLLKKSQSFKFVYIKNNANFVQKTGVTFANFVGFFIDGS